LVHGRSLSGKKRSAGSEE